MGKAAAAASRLAGPVVHFGTGRQVADPVAAVLSVPWTRRAGAAAAVI